MSEARAAFYWSDWKPGKNMDLFRKEAIEAQGAAPAIQVAPSPHLPSLLFWSAVLMSLASLAAGIASGAYQPDATVAGQVTDKVSFQVFRSPVSGYLKTVAAKPGQVVETGTVLMVIAREGGPSGGTCAARRGEAGTRTGDSCDVSIMASHPGKIQTLVGQGRNVGRGTIIAVVAPRARWHATIALSSSDREELSRQGGRLQVRVGQSHPIAMMGLLVPQPGAGAVGKSSGVARPPYQAREVLIELRTKSPWLTSAESTIGPGMEIVGVLHGHAPWARRL